MNEQPSKLTPALAGGAVMAVLSSVPIISIGNCICCLWILLGGAVAVIIYNRGLPEGQSVNGGEGAVLGLLAGIFGALFGTILSYLFMSLGDMGMTKNILRGIMERQNDLSPELENFLRNFEEGRAFSPGFILISLFASLFVNIVFGALGGLIGASLFKKKAAPIQGVGGK